MSESNKRLDKLDSLHALMDAGLPVLPFVILKEENFAEQIQEFLALHGLSRFMVRTDGKGKYSPSANNVALDQAILEIIKNYFTDGYVVFVMAPGNIYRNFHSLNIMQDDGKIHVEVVGPGFLATDLNRHGLIHESLESDVVTIGFKQKSITSPDAYARDKQKKLAELGEEQCRASKSYLLQYGTYPPCSGEELDYVSSSLSKLQNAAATLAHTPAPNFVASMSFIDLGKGTNEPIFWDLYVI